MSSMRMPPPISTEITRGITAQSSVYVPYSVRSDGLNSKQPRHPPYSGGQTVHSLLCAHCQANSDFHLPGIGK